MLIAAVAAAAAGLLLLRAQPHAVPAPPRLAGPPAAVPPTASASASPAPTALLVVDVVGLVRRPGVVRLPAGSRVVDALAAAGGLRRGAQSGMLNLAAVLADGQQVVVGAASPGGLPQADGTGAGGPAAAPSGVAPSATGPILDLNTATAEQLDTLPGVGPVLSQRILDWRTAHGRFTTIEQLTEVGGIGERRLAELRLRVRV